MALGRRRLVEPHVAVGEPMRHIGASTVPDEAYYVPVSTRPEAGAPARLIRDWVMGEAARDTQ